MTRQPGKSAELTIRGITVRLSRLDKQLFSDAEISKGDLISYYQSIAHKILPFLRDRPLVMGRYPDGINGEAFLQKNAPGHFPEWVTRAEVPKHGGTDRQVICDKPATLIYLANQACIELHPFLSRLGKLDQPDQLVFDLDPPDAGHFDLARLAALNLRALLTDRLDLAAYVNTTGGKGLHVHVPLRPGDHFDAVRDFARQTADLLVSQDPALFTTAQRRQDRGGRLYLDIMRNSYAQTAVAPYSVRARPGATIATPLHWHELEDNSLKPDHFTIRTIGKRSHTVSDPWAGMTRHRHNLSGPRRRLHALRVGSG